VPEERSPLPRFTSWPTFPFSGGLHAKQLDDPVNEEPPRRGEDPNDCPACRTPDEEYIWVSDRWRVRSLDRPTGLPAVLVLETRSHYDLGDLPNLLATELGLLTVRLERAVRSLDGVARVHVNRWGDATAHLHVWFLARPKGRLQLRGGFLPLWDEVLPPIPEPQWRDSLAMVAAWLADFGGTALAEPPHINWMAPARLTFGDSTGDEAEPGAGATLTGGAVEPPDDGSAATADKPRATILADGAEPDADGVPASIGRISVADAISNRNNRSGPAARTSGGAPLPGHPGAVNTGPSGGRIGILPAFTPEPSAAPAPAPVARAQSPATAPQPWTAQEPADGATPAGATPAGSDLAGATPAGTMLAGSALAGSALAGATPAGAMLAGSAPVGPAPAGLAPVGPAPADQTTAGGMATAAPPAPQDSVGTPLLSPPADDRSAEVQLGAAEDPSAGRSVTDRQPPSDAGVGKESGQATDLTPQPPDGTSGEASRSMPEATLHNVRRSTPDATESAVAGATVTEAGGAGAMVAEPGRPEASVAEACATRADGTAKRPVGEQDLPPDAPPGAEAADSAGAGPPGAEAADSAGAGPAGTAAAGPAGTAAAGPAGTAAAGPAGTPVSEEACPTTTKVAEQKPGGVGAVGDTIPAARSGSNGERPRVAER
jgi:hypothetical protein